MTVERDKPDTKQTVSTKLFSPETGITPSIAAVEAIAEVEGITPTELPTKKNIALNDHINPDALDNLMTDKGGESDIIVKFKIDEYLVLVENTGEVHVSGGNSESSHSNTE